MNKPFKLGDKNQGLEFIFLFSNADAFYVNARHSLLYNWVAVGCSNAHQSIELYIKAILKLNHEQEYGHDLVKLIEKYKIRDPYFSTILTNVQYVEFLNELSGAYLTYRYGEAGAEANIKEIIKLLDELVFNLRNIYIQNIKYPSNKIYVPDDMKNNFLADNANFTEAHIANNVFAQMGFPIDIDTKIST